LPAPESISLCEQCGAHFALLRVASVKEIVGSALAAPPARIAKLTRVGLGKRLAMAFSSPCDLRLRKVPFTREERPIRMTTQMTCGRVMGLDTPPKGRSTAAMCLRTLKGPGIGSSSQTRRR
jgi:hypothetical protein